ncbi:hypothetical protein SRABI106_02793 [Rahnella aquatilis]|nr:hypothetical protein SRABI106_02793 [Rahnella aquatilis]
MTEFAISQRVMQQLTFTLRRQCWRTHDMHDGHIFRITTGNAIQCAQFADTKWRQQRRNTFGTGVTICAIGGI